MKPGKLIVKSLTDFALDVVMTLQISPKPGAKLFNKLFDRPETITEPAAYNLAKEKVTVELDLTYESVFKNNTYDFYFPNKTEALLPVLFWVHGGGYVGGDKIDVREFATRLVADTAIAIVSINYGLAPDSKYPNQLLQLNEMVCHIQNNTQAYKMLDMTQVFLGGDSAGAQIALQYAALQTNNDYARQMSVEQVIPKENLKGSLSYCGPVDLKQQINQTFDNRFMNFFIRTVAWSLIGTKKWHNSKELQEASVASYLTKDFPPTYVTDGNAFTFSEQGITLVERLIELKIPVQSLFHTENTKQIPHEYQFNFSTDEAKQSYQKTVEFIGTHIPLSTSVNGCDYSTLK
ncbi:putative lipase [Carnobacterium sp. 17-4]|uniref:alpha/beta hydrolase n=1 Tax=Carnobacterium sp. (strain 17-4) TaxID=208596 RepID=UPI000205936C|nr:alpha/beta hydrolase [Carnobacterium sp. 17-4]AEB31008.1 putative lipase [Carnobacterium sp. 17-4]